jgi:signal transduction histidine kinase
MSHEIRTPLTLIIGFAEILARKLEGELGTFAEKAHRSGNRLMRTLKSVLELSRLEAGTFDLERTQVQYPRSCKIPSSAFGRRRSKNTSH